MNDRFKEPADHLTGAGKIRSVFPMTTILLIVIYIAFIGLGVPDSLFGTAWPAVYEEFGLPLASGSFVTVIMSVGTVLSSMLSARLLSRFGTGRVTLVSTLLTAIAILGMAKTGSFWFMCLCALPLGLGAGAIDTGLNNYVSLHYSAAQMSFLHCFYGIGITVSPLLIARAMSGDSGWRGGYFMAFWIQIAIALILLVSLSLWKKESNDESDESVQVMSLREIARTPGVKLMWIMFFASVTIEMSCGGWACTYLVESKGISAQTGAQLILYYFLGIATGRFLSGLLAMKLQCHTIIKCGMAVLGCGIVILLLASSARMAVTALFLIAMGNSPMFPNFTYLTPMRFGKEKSASIMGTQFAVSNIAYMVMPVVCSLLGQALGMWIFPWFILLSFIVLLAATLLFRPGRGKRLTFLFPALIAIAVLSGCNDSTFKLSGTVEPDSGLTEVYISVGIEGETDRFMPEEKLPVINRRFTYSCEIKEIVKANIRKDLYSNTSVFLVPGETLKLTYSVNGYSYGGSRIYRECRDADNAITPSRNAMDDYVDKFYSEQARIRPDEVLARKDTMTRLSEEYFGTMTRYIRDNSDKEGVILYFSQTYPIDSLACFMGERVRQGRVGKYVDRLVRRTNEQRAQIRQNRIDEQKKLNVGIGTKAKDFTLYDLDGKPLSLSSLKGKYVILDFWGSWCGWCIRGFPKMKEYYEKYNDKMEILGIDCNDSLEAWHAAVEKYGLPWLHVYNPDSSSLTEDYWITGYPTKIIIGPEGEIVKVIAGEDLAFYSFLDELL